MNFAPAVNGLLSKHGMDIEVVEQTKTGTDDYGDNIYDANTTTINGRVDRSVSPDETVQAGGSEITVDADIYVSAGYDLTFNTVQDEEPTVLKTQGESYKILMTDDQKNSVLRLRCKRE